jgi:hypothetical protein
MRRAACFLLVWLICWSDDLRAGADRLVLVKIDGLPVSFFEAVLDPESREVLNLPRPELFRSAHDEVKEAFGREILLPNLLHYLGADGCRVTGVRSGTVGVSTPAWAVIQTGRPSVIKANAWFNRSTGQVRFFLDVFRHTMRNLVAKAGRTAPVWELDLLGIPLMEDFFGPERTWTSIQILYRQVPGDQLGRLGRNFMQGANDPSLGFIRGHLDSWAEGYDFPDQSDQAAVEIAVEKLLRKGSDGLENIDYLSLFFPSLDHQFHADANYRRTIEYMVKIDDWFGQVMNAVERSGRRDTTVVAVVSDHGSDFDPVQLNRSFPISRWLRREEFGGHTILSPYSERIAAAFTRPVRGIDTPRIYESDDSPYGSRVPFGEDGYVTCYTNHQGNARFEAFLRNSDLNELHLILLRARRQAGADVPLGPLFSLYVEALSKVSAWLDDEIQATRAAAEELSALARRIENSSSPTSDDSAARLEEESRHYRNLLPRLNRLRSLPRAESDWESWVRAGFEMSEWIPKGYLGPPNGPEQLRRYVVGWEVGVSTDGDEDLRFRVIDYPELFNRFRLTNPNSYGVYHPFDFFVVGLPPADLTDRSHIPRQVLWLVASDSRGQAIVVEDSGGLMRYSPVLPLEFDEGRAVIRPDAEAQDPFDFRFATMERAYSPSDWMDRVGDSVYATLPIVLLDLFRDNYSPFIGSSHFPKKYQAYGIEDLEELGRTLHYRFGRSRPDFRVWLNRGWNANPNVPTPTGSHGGFHPLDSRIVFALWGGRDTGAKRGETVAGHYFTWDIAPTLLEMLGLRNTVDPPLPGSVIPVYESGERFTRVNR